LETLEEDREPNPEDEAPDWKTGAPSVVVPAEKSGYARSVDESNRLESQGVRA
jgi:hypothetical protein